MIYDYFLNALDAAEFKQQQYHPVATVYNFLIISHHSVITNIFALFHRLFSFKMILTINKLQKHMTANTMNQLDSGSVSHMSAQHQLSQIKIHLLS
jgi:hypothetical protein